MLALYVYRVSQKVESLHLIGHVFKCPNRNENMLVEPHLASVTNIYNNSNKFHYNQ